MTYQVVRADGAAGWFRHAAYMAYLRDRRAITPEKTAALPIVPADGCARGYEQYLRQWRDAMLTNIYLPVTSHSSTGR